MYLIFFFFLYLSVSRLKKKLSESNTAHIHLIMFSQVESPKLQTWSKKSKKDGHRQYIDRRSKTDEFVNRPFFVHWKNGRVKNLYFTADKPPFQENFEKGVAALFQVHVLRERLFTDRIFGRIYNTMCMQFQLSDGRVVERSMLGECNVTYVTVNDDTVSKTIDGCVPPKTLPEIKHPDKVRHNDNNSSFVIVLFFLNFL